MTADSVIRAHCIELNKEGVMTDGMKVGGLFSEPEGAGRDVPEAIRYEYSRIPC